MNFHGKRVFVTGAGGFIGSHLVERLVQDGARVRAFVHYNSGDRWGNLELLQNDILAEIEVVAGDITDPFSVKKSMTNCSVVFHLAALIGIPYSYTAPQSYVMTNIVGSMNVLEACINTGVEKVIHTSTSEVYGSALYTPIDERHPLQGQSPYSASKIGADKIAESYYRSFGLPLAIVRPFNTYGPRQSARAIIPVIISQLLARKSCIKLGSLEPIRDFTYISDTVNGFLAVGMSEKTPGEVVNIGSGEAISIGNVANMIMEIVGMSAEIVTEKERMRPEKSEVTELICSNAKARDICNWKPECSLREGLSKTIDSIGRNMDRFKTDRYAV